MALSENIKVPHFVYNLFNACQFVRVSVCVGS